VKPISFMLIAGEPSGDLLAAELVQALRPKVLEIESVPTGDVQPLRTELAPKFFGAGREHMKTAGVEIAVDMTPYALVGFSEVVKNWLPLRRVFRQLLKLAIERQPDVIIGVDYGGFNLRFGKAIKKYVRRHYSEFTPWNPKLVQFVSPQVWASRPGRADELAKNYDLLLSIFPFEKEWYARRVPKLHVEFVGHPMIGRSPKSNAQSPKSESAPCVVVLPGSRNDEVRRHWPVVTEAFERMRREVPSLRGKVVLPSEALAQSARASGAPAGLEIEASGLNRALEEADVAVTKSGTVTMECAFHGVPAVVFYKTSWPTYCLGKFLVTVPHLAMPNLLAGEEIFPEFVQHAATPENIARAALDLLCDDSRRRTVKSKLAQIVASLGGPGAAARAAEAIVSLLP
jgi:lipid-A-disaccharide synthase